MSKQPEALRLADALDVVWAAGVAPEAAAELRRLHAERTAADGVINDLAAKVRGLHTQRDALMEALERSRAQWIHSVNADRCLAAIAKAQQLLEVTPAQMAHAEAIAKREQT